MRRALTGACALLLALTGTASGQSLSGSTASLDIQNRMAHEHEFTYLRTGSQVDRFVGAGYLVPIRAGAEFDLHAVSFPYARPEVLLFLERLGSQYRAACGEKLVVTSLTRPQNRQPRNASDRSVHPTGMAIDLRRSSSRACRAWLEGVLISLERRGVLEATRERWPPHYHVALFPRQYASYVAGITNTEVVTRIASVETPRAPEVRKYEVRPGDSLWTIARRHGTTVDRIKSDNDLRSNRIYAGQVIQVPATR